MPKVSVYQLMRDSQNKSGSSKKYRSGALSKDEADANILIQNDDNGKTYQNYYKYSDPEAAQRAYNDFMAEAEMADELDAGGRKKGGAIDLSKCKVNTAKKNKSGSSW